MTAGEGSLIVEVFAYMKPTEPQYVRNFLRQGFITELLAVKLRARDPGRPG